MTVDSSGMTAGLAQSQGLIRQMDQRLRHSGDTAGALDRGVKAIGTSLQKGTIDAKGLAQAFGGPAGVAFAIGGAVAMAQRLFSQMLTVREEMESTALSARREWEEAAAAIGKFKGEMTDTTATVSQQWKRFWNESNAYMSAYFDEFLTQWGAVASASAMGLGIYLEKRGYDSYAGNEARVKALKEETEEIKKQAELQAKMQAAQLRERENSLRDMASRARQLTKEAMTPAQSFVAAWREITQLAAANAISADTAIQARIKAMHDLVNAAGITVDLKKVADVRIGAAERGTAAGHSATVARDYQQARVLQIQQLQLEAQKRAASLLEEIKRLQSREHPPSVVFRPSNF